MVPLKGSAKAAPDAAKMTTINTSDAIDVTIRIRRKRSLDTSLKDRQQYSLEEYEKEFGAAQSDIELIEQFAADNHLSVTLIDHARRSVILRGKIKYFETAFQVHLANYDAGDGRMFRGRSGQIHIPANLEGVVEGVFGLDNRAAAQPLFQVLKMDGAVNPRTVTFSGYAPNDVANAYGYPQNVTGKGQCIALIELDGGYRKKDLGTYFSTLQRPLPKVKAVGVDGGYNNPGTANGPDAEVMLDIEVAGAVASGAKIVVYFAPNTDQGFLDAITTALHDKVNRPAVISISWGAAESGWTQQSMNSYNEAFKAASVLGVTICAAAGDMGSSDQQPGVNGYDGHVHVDFPASSPYVLACGGTRAQITNHTVSNEIVWHDAVDSATGGGVSDFFPLPDYQLTTGVPLSAETKFKGRGIPDVAGNASPNTGYKILVDGQWAVIGGTSAVAPLMAAFFALNNEKKNSKAGFVQPKLYATPNNFCRDITQGDNITTPSNIGYTAGVGWDACSGWGVMSSY